MQSFQVVSVLDEQRRVTMVDGDIETSSRGAIVRSMELGLAVQGPGTIEIDDGSASRDVAINQSRKEVVR